MGKNILAGISTSHFNSKENDPEKIILHNFSPIASDIAAKFTTIVKPEPLNKSTSKATKGMK